MYLFVCLVFAFVTGVDLQGILRQDDRLLPPNGCYCPVTSQYDLVCATDGKSYKNRELLECYRRCVDRSLQVTKTGKCGSQWREPATQGQSTTTNAQNTNGGSFQTINGQGTNTGVFQSMYPQGGNIGFQNTRPQGFNTGFEPNMNSQGSNTGFQQNTRPQGFNGFQQNPNSQSINYDLDDYDVLLQQNRFHYRHD